MFSNILLEKLVRPSRAGGGLNESYNQIAQDALNRKLLESEALSKAAYANWVGPQSLMSFLNTPGVAQNIGDQQYAKLTQLANSMMGQSIAGAQQQTSSNPFSTFLNHAVGLLTGRQPQQNAVMQPPVSRGVSGGNAFSSQPQPALEMGGGTGDYGGDLSKQNAPVVNPPAEPVNLPVGSKTGIPQTAVGSLAESKKTQGQAGGANIPALFKAEELGLQQYHTGQIGNIIKQQDDMYKVDDAAANNALKQNQLFDKLEDSYRRLGYFEKGNWTKLYGQALSDAANEFDNTKAQISQSIAAGIQSTGHVNEADRLSADVSKPGRNMSDLAFAHLINFAKSQNDRLQEKPLFDQTLAKLGFDPNQVDIMWRYYNTRRPFYNNKTHTADKNNLNSWDTFFSENKGQNAKAAFSPQAQKEIDKVYNRGEKQNDIIMMITPEGDEVPVHRSNINIAKNKYKFKEKKKHAK